MTHLQILIILLTVFMSACAQFFLKLGMNKATMAGGLLDNGLSSLAQAVFSPLVLSGLCIYGVSVLVWLWILSKVELSVAYPFVGISFIFTLIFGVVLLNESLNIYKVVGTFLIASGCLLVAKST